MSTEPASPVGVSTDAGKQHLDFLYRAIDDCQNIIKLVDTKAAVSLAPIGFMLNKLFSEVGVPEACVHRFCWQNVLKLAAMIVILIASFQAYKVLFPLINPVEHVDIPQGLAPAFFLGRLAPKRWQALFSGRPRFSRFSQRFDDYQKDLDAADENKLKQVLIGELLKVSYIRDMKMFRLTSLGFMLIIAALLFIFALIFEPGHPPNCIVNNVGH